MVTQIIKLCQSLLAVFLVVSVLCGSSFGLVPFVMPGRSTKVRIVAIIPLVYEVFVCRMEGKGH